MFFFCFYNVAVTNGCKYHFGWLWVKAGVWCCCVSFVCFFVEHFMMDLWRTLCYWSSESAGDVLRVLMELFWRFLCACDCLNGCHLPGVEFVLRKTSLSLARLCEMTHYVAWISKGETGCFFTWRDWEGFFKGNLLVCCFDAGFLFCGFWNNVFAALTLVGLTSFPYKWPEGCRFWFY